LGEREKKDRETTGGLISQGLTCLAGCATWDCHSC
jgi:hypothetical protein